MLQLMNSESSVNSLMIQGDCLCCRDSACWLTLNCTAGEKRHLHKPQTQDKTPTSECPRRNRHEKWNKCRQNSNLLITYLFFTFVREGCGRWGAAEVTKMASSGKRPSLWNLLLLSRQIKTAFHRVFPEEARQAMPPALSTCQRLLNFCAQIRITHINLQRFGRHGWLFRALQLFLGGKFGKKTDWKTARGFAWKKNERR